MAGCVAASPVLAVEGDDLTRYPDQTVMRIDTRESCLAAGVDLRLRDGMGERCRLKWRCMSRCRWGIATYGGAIAADYVAMNSKVTDHAVTARLRDGLPV